MAEAGKIYSQFTHIEIDEQGKIWLIQNHFESESVILEMESSFRGSVIVDDGWDMIEEDILFGDDYM
jgi:hypothetical protein